MSKRIWGQHVRDAANGMGSNHLGLWYVDILPGKRGPRVERRMKLLVG